jgi:hypothetical protein
MERMSMVHKTGCLVCGNDLKYLDNNRSMNCFYCGISVESNTSCTNGHYVCDTCHSSSANDLIERYCISSDSINPMASAITLMKNPAIKMHGPEHHFLVPAVLLMAFYNKKNLSNEEKVNKISLAKKRSEDIKGGFCGFCGACGAGIGTGIYISLISNANPLSKLEWKLSNQMTSQSLAVIAEHGGPRCCKRDTYYAIQEAAAFSQKEFNVILDIEPQIVCSFSDMNKECLKEACEFHSNHVTK